MATCMFCATRRADSKEHIFGKWWVKYDMEESFPLSSCFMNFTSRLTNDGQFTRSRGPIGTAPKSYQASYKAVCSKCNNEWMSRIEQEMCETYEKCFCGNSRRLRATDRNAMIHWVFLKSCLQEKAIKLTLPSNVLPSDLRTSATEMMQKNQQLAWSKFFSNRETPSGLRTFLLRNGEERSARINMMVRPHLVVLGDYCEYIDQRLIIIGKCDFCAVQTNVPEIIRLLENFPIGLSATLDGKFPSVLIPRELISAEELDFLLVSEMNRNGSSFYPPLSMSRWA